MIFTPRIRNFALTAHVRVWGLLVIVPVLLAGVMMIAGNHGSNAHTQPEEIMKRAMFVVFLLAVTTTFAQHQPYAGQQEREIKALSPDEVKQYLAGAGMGYAKSAELNRFPGPMHVLELAEKLDLTPEQRERTKVLMDTHKSEVRAIGTKRVESERAIEMLFRSGSVDDAMLAKSVREAAALDGEYRLAHLETHRRMQALLTEEQVARYDRLRGYAGGGEHRRQH